VKSNLIKIDEDHPSDILFEKMEEYKEYSANEAKDENIKEEPEDSEDAFNGDSDMFSQLDDGFDSSNPGASRFDPSVISTYELLKKGIRGVFESDSSNEIKFVNSETNDTVYLGEAYCKNCKIGINKYAFLKKQFLVGFVGQSTVGKSCLMTSIVFHMREKNHILYKTNYGKYNVNGANDPKISPEDTYLNIYNNGENIPKTITGNEKSHINNKGFGQTETVIFNVHARNSDSTEHEVIYNFIDIAGECFQKNNEGELDKDRIENIFKSIKKCDLYIFCTDCKENSDIGNMGEEFIKFTGKHAPVILAKTKADECGSWDPSKKEDENILNHPDNRSLNAFYDSLKNKVYITLIECSAYGFNPNEAQENTKPEPKNIDTITDMILKFSGIKDFVIKKKRKTTCHRCELVSELSDGISTSYPRHNDSIAEIKDRYFWNITNYDEERLRTVGDPLGHLAKMIKSRFK
jgi:GTPase SAR1 family protein